MSGKHGKITIFDYYQGNKGKVRKKLRKKENQGKLREFFFLVSVISFVHNNIK